MLILAGTAALSGAVVPVAVADAPTDGPGQSAASSDECQLYRGAHDYAIEVAGDAIATGDLGRALEYAGYAAEATQLATERGC